MQSQTDLSQASWRTLLSLALALSMGAATSLGFGRFAYALLLTPMRNDLQWDYATAGALNTANAVGYLIGALATPWCLRRTSVTQLVALAAWGGAALMFLSPWIRQIDAWLVVRLLAGVTSAFVFLCGGVLAARLGAIVAQSGDPQIRSKSGFVVALFYAGTGVGISLSAITIPGVLQWFVERPADAWGYGWIALGLLSSLAAMALMWPLRALSAAVAAPTAASANTTKSDWRGLLSGLLGYSCFGLGYIGYMTFCIALVREQGGGNALSLLFFLLLGIACAFSANLWGKLLQRRDGRPMATLNALIGLATLIAALLPNPITLLLSAALFGGCFLQVVGSTTAMVRHHWPQSEWTRGITIFTCVFAAGQIVGPLVTGFISDSALGLRGGLLASGIVLLLGAAVASRQRGPVTL